MALPYLAPAPNPAPEYNPLKEASVMVPLITKQDIISTYSAKEQFSCRKYSEYQKLIAENPSFGYKRAAKILGVKPGKTRWWHTKGEKRAVPLPLKAVQKLKDAGLLPFYENHKDAEIIFNMLGVLFGDGGVDALYNGVAFISSDKNDIDLWESDLRRAFPSANGKIDIIEGGEYGHSYNIRCYDRSVIRFFAALGAPVGDKVSIVYSLPKWIFNSSDNSRAAFLDGYLAAEVSVVRWRADSLGNFRFTDFAVGISKIEFLENEHRIFMKSLEALLKSVGIQTTGNIHKNSGAGTHRKDGAFSASYRIFIRTTFHRVLFFNEKFQLRYASWKKRKMVKVIQKAVYEKNGQQIPENYLPES